MRISQRLRFCPLESPAATLIRRLELQTRYRSYSLRMDGNGRRQADKASIHHRSYFHVLTLLQKQYTVLRNAKCGTPVKN